MPLYQIFPKQSQWENTTTGKGWLWKYHNQTVGWTANSYNKSSRGVPGDRNEEKA